MYALHAHVYTMKEWSDELGALAKKWVEGLYLQESWISNKSDRKQTRGGRSTHCTKDPICNGTLIGLIAICYSAIPLLHCSYELYTTLNAQYAMQH